eukprot:2434298-Rhodomonas_salina.3
MSIRAASDEYVRRCFSQTPDLLLQLRVFALTRETFGAKLPRCECIQTRPTKSSCSNRERIRVAGGKFKGGLQAKATQHSRNSYACPILQRASRHADYNFVP